MTRATVVGSEANYEASLVDEKYDAEPETQGGHQDYQEQRDDQTM